MGTNVSRTTVRSELRLSSVPRVSVSISPNLTALAVVADALAGRRRGLPDAWRKAIAARVRATGHQAARPIGAPGHSVVPDSVVPLAPPLGDVPMREQLDALRDVPPDRLIRDLEQAFGPAAVPAHWRPAAARPERWLRGYASALADVWSAVEPLWRRARPLLDREIARVGVASMRGAPELLLGSLNRRVVCTGGSLFIADIEPSAYDLGDRPIVLVPMLAGEDSVIVSLDGPGAVWIAYPLPGSAALWRRPAAPDPAPAPAARVAGELAALVGPVRARLLLALDRPMTMSALATRLNLAPGGLTYHCDRLRAARLVARERRGREVWISRTGRADDLLELFRH
ncbi:winged helix-turn-helix domain-containing protein [Nonomuraea pusilla]|uniref:ArsR/SmtB family transcription factor n=1 Tax=Nonomuraea pusilla TaxID=46177 RepID=UPI003325D8D1